MCRCARFSVICCSVFFGIFAVILIVVAVIGFIVIPNMLEGVVEEEMRFNSSNEMYKLWEKTPIPIEHFVYIFEVLNPDEIINDGKKPNITERGPYTIYQLNNKNVVPGGVNITYTETEIYSLIIEKDDSINDVIYVMNAPLFTILSWAETNEVLLNKIIANIDYIFPNSNVVFETSVKELLYEGVRICVSPESKVICDEIDVGSNKFMTKNSDGSILFSFFHKKILDGASNKAESYEILRGIDDIQNLAKIVKWNDKTEMDTWNKDGVTTKCNEIRGTDGIFYAPLFNSKDNRHVFNKEICRSITLYYNGKSKVNETRTYSMIAGEDMLSSTGDNECFCKAPTADKCLKKGAMDLYPCLGAHMVLTFPHFLMADDVYKNEVTGLKPDPKIHQYISDLEPYFGFPLSSCKRLQYNMFLRKFKNLESTNKFEKPVLFPIIWVDERVFIPNGIIEGLNDIYYYIDIFDKVKWILIGISGVFTVITGIILVICLFM